MYGSIRRYRIRMGSVNDIVEQVRTGLVPILEKMPGFVGYYILNAEANKATSITIADSKDAIDGINRAALDWVRTNLPDRLSEPEVWAGPMPVALMHQHA